MAHKVLIIGQFPPPITGESKVNLQVQQVLAAAGYSVAVLNSCIIRDVNDVGKVSAIKILLMLNLLVIGIFRILKVDIVYMTPGQTLFGLLRFLPFLWLAKVAGKKVILHWHGYGVLGIFTKFKRLAKSYLSQAVTNIVLTDDFRTRLLQLGFNVQHVHVVSNFSEFTPEFVPKKAEHAKLKVVYLGGLMPEKGVDTFLALAQKTSQFDFVLCGAGNTVITSQAVELASSGAISFLGVVDGDEKTRLMLEADIFVLQTYYATEGVPLTILEAMSCGCAIVTTYHNGIPETVGNAALYVEARSQESLEITLKRLDSDRPLLAELQYKAALRSKIYSIQTFTKQLLAVFQQC